MTSIVSPYRSDVAIGRLFLGGKEIQVFGSDFFIRYLNQQILDRLGGTDQQTITELVQAIGEINDASLAPRDTSRSNELATALDDLANLFMSLRSDCDQLRSALLDRDAEIAGLRSVLDLRNRVEQLEDRLI